MIFIPHRKGSDIGAEQQIIIKISVGIFKTAHIVRCPKYLESKWLLKLRSNVNMTDDSNKYHEFMKKLDESE